MNNKIKKIISIILVLICMTVIFCFSATPADESDLQSKGIIYKIAEKLQGKKAEEIENIDMLNHLIRKFAHASIYFLLCILVMNSIFQIKNDNKFIYNLVAIGICFLYACTDEYHQLFIEGRAGQFTDVLIDTAGASLGCAIVVLIYKLIYRKKL